jgi:hypothetical protein
MVGRGGEGDPPYLRNMISPGKSGLSIVFRGLNNLENKSYISPCKSYEGCKTQCAEGGSMALVVNFKI